MRYLSTLFSLAVATLTITAPQSAGAQSVKPLLDSLHYVFQPWTAQSETGEIHHLNDNSYTLEIARDKVVSNLPYYGRAYVAPFDATTGFLEFSSLKFTYSVKPRKKDGWIVLIKPQDDREITQLQLVISSRGYATLQVLSPNRQSITFDGIVIAPDKH
jgi:Domain of unknown function (DUF4251)